MGTGGKGQAEGKDSRLRQSRTLAIPGTLPNHTYGQLREAVRPLKRGKKRTNFIDRTSSEAWRKVGEETSRQPDRRG